jgi:PST family polysaccharide transporter
VNAEPKSLKNAFGWSLVQHWGARAISFSVFFVLARLLTPADFGLVALSSIVIAFTEIFIDQGFSDAVVQSHDDSDSFLSTAFWVNMSVATVLVILVVLTSTYLARLFHAPKLVPINRVLSLTFLLTALSSVQIALLRRRMDYKSLAARTTAANLISGIASITLAFLGFGVWSLVVQQIVFGIVSTVVVWRIGAFRPSLHVDGKSFRELMHFGLKVCGVRTVDLLHTKLIDALVGVYLGALILGIYSVGTKLGLILMQLLGTSVADVSLAHFSELRRSRSDIGGAYLKMVHRLALTSVPLFTFLALEARPLVHIVFGKKWDNAAPIFAAFCVAGIVQVLIYFSSSAMSAVGRPGIQLTISIVKLALYVAGFYIFFRHGLNAVAWSMTAITLVLIAPTSFVIVAQLLQFKLADLVKQLWLPYLCVATASALTFFSNRYFSPVSIAGLAVAVLVFFLTFGICAFGLDKEARILGRRAFRIT